MYLYISVFCEKGEKNGDLDFKYEWLDYHPGPCLQNGEMLISFEGTLDVQTFVSRNSRIRESLCF